MHRIDSTRVSLPIRNIGARCIHQTSDLTKGNFPPRITLITDDSSIVRQSLAAGLPRFEGFYPTEGHRVVFRQRGASVPTSAPSDRAMLVSENGEVQVTVWSKLRPRQKETFLLTPESGTVLLLKPNVRHRIVCLSEQASILVYNESSKNESSKPLRRVRLSNFP